MQSMQNGVESTQHSGASDHGRPAHGGHVVDAKSPSHCTDHHVCGVLCGICAQQTGAASTQHSGAASAQHLGAAMLAAIPIANAIIVVWLARNPSTQDMQVSMAYILTVLAQFAVFLYLSSAPGVHLTISQAAFVSSLIFLPYVHFYATDDTMYRAVE